VGRMNEQEFVSAVKDLVSDYAFWIWFAIIVHAVLSGD